MRLPIPENAHILQDCWNENFQVTTLTDALCHFCGSMGQRVQKQTVEPPCTLVVHLKRFSYEGNIASKTKTHIQVPMHGWRPVQNGPRYKLVATVDHHGESIESGHYSAKCLHDQWWQLNDTSAQLTSPASVSSKDNYLLFYKAQ